MYCNMIQVNCFPSDAPTKRKGNLFLTISECNWSARLILFKACCTSHNNKKEFRVFCFLVQLIYAFSLSLLQFNPNFVHYFIIYFERYIRLTVYMQKLYDTVMCILFVIVSKVGIKHFDFNLLIKLDNVRRL